MPPQAGSPGRAGQPYSGLGAFRRAQGAQARWSPQAQVALERTGGRAAAGAARQREEWMRMWGRLAEQERAERLAATGDLLRSLGLAFEQRRLPDPWAETQRITERAFAPRVQEAFRYGVPGQIPLTSEGLPTPSGRIGFEEAF